ncbi:MAG: hypothetical protein WEE36_00830 [Acidimicrobiia bacterium]
MVVVVVGGTVVADDQVTMSWGGLPPSNESAVRVPVPVNTNPIGLPGAQSGRDTTSWMTAARSGVRWSAPASPTLVHGGGCQVAVAVVRGRLEGLALVVYGAAEPEASAPMTRVAGADPVSSTENWIQAPVMVAPVGSGRPVKRIPTVWGTFSSTSSRSDEVVSNHPVANSSTSSPATATATVAVDPDAGARGTPTRSPVTTMAVMLRAAPTAILDPRRALFFTGHSLSTHRV